MSVTEPRTAVRGLSHLGDAASLNLADLSAGGVVGEDVLGVVATFWLLATLPAAAPAIAVEPTALIHV